MFWRKKKAEAAEAGSTGETPKARRRPVRAFFRFLRRFCKYACLLLLLLLAAAFGGLVWLTQTEGGQAWLVDTANAALARPEGADGLDIRLTNLTGSIPADFSFGLTLADRHGIWLTAPQNRLVWDWRNLPGAVVFPLIEVANLDASRLPDLPPTPPEEPEPEKKPLTVEELQEYLREAANFLAQKHWWLPVIRFEQVELKDALLPGELLPGQREQRPCANVRLALAFVENTLDGEFGASLKGSPDQRLALPNLSMENLGATVRLKAGPKANGLFANASLEASITDPLLAVADVPANLLGGEAKLRLELEAEAETSASTPGLKLVLVGPNLDAGQLAMRGEGSWRTDQGWQTGAIAGPLACRLDFAFAPLPAGAKSPLAAIRQPARLELDIQGDLPRLNLGLGLACAELAQSGHQVKDVKISIAANEIELPLGAMNLQALEKENHLKVDLAALVDQHKVATGAEIFFQALRAADPGQLKGWRLGLRDLAINALGLHGGGNLAVLLPAGAKPGVDGKIEIAVKDWAEINNFIPGQRLSGDVQLEARFSSGLAPELANPGSRPTVVSLPAALALSQNADITIRCPAFAVAASGAKRPTVELASLESKAKLSDIFKNLALAVKLDADKIVAAGLRLSASAQAQGVLAGPIRADLSTKGSINSRFAGQWEPGKAQLGTLEVVADVAALMGKKGGKKLLAGLRSNTAAQVTYGERGVQVKNLSLNLLPGGSLRANGGMAPDKLDFQLKLDNLQLAPWQALVPAIPSGQINADVALAGSPARPAGNFRLDVRELAVPKSPLAPLSLALTGKLEHGGGVSLLKTNLALDPKTVKALGGTTAQVAASLPLLFGPDGIPKPLMSGPLAATARWDGALGPLWKLVPLADQRVNGRVNLDLSAGGTLERPLVRGSANISQARYENLLYGVLLTDINLKVALTDAIALNAKGGLPGGVTLDLSVSDGRGGSVTAKGKGALTGDDLEIKAKIRDLKPLRRRDVHIELSGHAEVTGSATAPVVNGQISVDKGEILLNNLEIASTSVTTLKLSSPEEAAKALKAAEQAAQSAVDAAVKKAARPGGKSRVAGRAAKPQRTAGNASLAPPAAAGPAGGGRINLRFIMQPRFSVEGRGLASIWKANLLIQGPLANPQVSGNISSVRGNFDFLGKNFALTRGVVFFGGGSLANPLVDIDLTNETPDLTAHILVTGPVNKIKLKLTSDPQVPRDEILSRVLFGRSVNDLSRMEALQLAGAVAQLAGFGGGSGPLGMAKKALGVDVLRIGTSDTGATGENNAGGTNVEMGKYINDFIYMGVQQGLKPDSTAFIIEIELTPHSNVELRTEQNNTWAGYRWKINY